MNVRSTQVQFWPFLVLSSHSFLPKAPPKLRFKSPDVIWPQGLRDRPQFPGEMTCEDSWVTKRSIDLSNGESTCTTFQKGTSCPLQWKEPYKVSSLNRNPCARSSRLRVRILPFPQYAGTFLPALLEEDFKASKDHPFLVHADASGPEISRSRFSCTSAGLETISAFVLRGAELQRDDRILSYPVFSIAKTSVQ